MSAVAGIVGLDGRHVSDGEVESMVGRMRHRGPDRLGAWSRGRVGLGHAMLETTPESLVESLPLVAGPFAITADARIDNRDTLLAQLRPDLAALDLEAETIPDSSLILAAYARWGRRCAEHLLGDFAFAVWDEREHMLFCARDHLGVRPLYYTHRPGVHFVVASEPKGVFEADGVDVRIDEDRVAENLSARIYDPVRTSFEGIEKVPAAHTLTVSARGLVLERYWTLAPKTDVQRASYADGFAEVFTEAVRCRVRSAFPIGSELSGGLDSSAVTAVAAREIGDRPLHTVSLAYSDPRTDERRFGQAILDRLGDQAIDHYVHPERERIISLYTEIFQTLDDLRVRGNGYGTYLTSREAGRQGVRVLLTGQDGDTAVGHGWEWFAEQALAGEWDQLRGESERVFARCRVDQEEHDSQFIYQRSTQIASSSIAPLLQYWAEEKAYLPFARTSLALRRHFGASLWAPWKQYWKQLVTPGSVLRRRALRITADTARKQIPATLDPSLVARTDIVARLAHQIRAEAAHSRGRFTALDAQLDALTADGVEGNLHKNDLYASASGVEARHPFMDVRLLEYCLAIPSGEKLRDGYTRYVLRDALHADLPDLVRDRMNKMDHGAQQARFIFASETARVEELLRDPGYGARYLDLDVVRDLWRRGVAAPMSLSAWESAAVSGAITTLLWFEVSPLAARIAGEHGGKPGPEEGGDAPRTQGGV